MDNKMEQRYVKRIELGLYNKETKNGHRYSMGTLSAETIQWILENRDKPIICFLSKNPRKIEGDKKPDLLVEFKEKLIRRDNQQAVVDSKPFNTEDLPF